MQLLLKTLGVILVIILPLVSYLVSLGTGNYRYFFYSLSSALAAILTYFIMKRLLR